MSANSEDPEAVASALLFLSNISQNCKIAPWYFRLNYPLAAMIKAKIKNNQEFSTFLRSYIHEIKVCVTPIQAKSYKLVYFWIKGWSSGVQGGFDKYSLFTVRRNRWVFVRNA